MFAFGKSLGEYCLRFNSMQLHYSTQIIWNVRHLNVICVLSQSEEVKYGNCGGIKYYLGFHCRTMTFPGNFNLWQFNFYCYITLPPMNFGEGDLASKKKTISSCLKFPFTKGRLCFFSVELLLCNPVFIYRDINERNIDQPWWTTLFIASTVFVKSQRD